MDGQENKEYWETRSKVLALKLDEAMKFIDKEGLSDVFFETTKPKQRRN